MWRRPRGMQIATNFAFGRFATAERSRFPVLLAVSEYIRQNAFGDDVTDEQEEFLWNFTDRLFGDLIDRGVIKPAQIVQLGLAWKGTTNFLGWSSVASSLEPQTRAGFAYILGQRYLRLKNDKEAGRFFDTAQKDVPADFDAAKLAALDAALLARGRGQLVVENQTDRPITLQATRADEPPLSFEVSGTRTVELPAGDYQVSLATPNENALPSKTTVHIAPARRDRVVIGLKRKPGDVEFALPGLIPTPALLPEIGRWQVITTMLNETVDAVAWSPDGRWLACSSRDGFVRVFDGKTKKLARVLTESPRYSNCLAWSPDGNRLTTAGSSKTVCLWNTQSWSVSREFENRHSRVQALVWRPDGMQLAVVTYLVSLWNTVDAAAEPIEISTPNFRTLSWHPDGDEFVTAGWDGLFRFRRLDNLEETILGTLPRQLRGIDISPDGTQIAISSDASHVTLLRTVDRTTRQLRGHVIGVLKSRWSPDGRRLATVSFDRTLKVKKHRPASPNLQAHVERWIQSVQQECLDHFIVLGERHLDYIVREYVDYYNNLCPHEGCDHLKTTMKDPPPEMTTIPLDDVVCHERLGGLLKHYERRAA